jgi:hypothetical protein
MSRKQTSRHFRWSQNGKQSSPGLSRFRGIYIWRAFSKLRSRSGDCESDARSSLHTHRKLIRRRRLWKITVFTRKITKSLKLYDPESIQGATIELNKFINLEENVKFLFYKINEIIKIRLVGINRIGRKSREVFTF